MSEYQQQALDFLASCNATMEMTFIGTEVNQNWNDNTRRNKYNVIITTPRGRMVFYFWDSAVNTEITLMTLDKFCKLVYHRYLENFTYAEKQRLQKELKKAKAGAVPTEYSVLACLTKYDPGTMDDFFHEMGYEVKGADDVFCFLNTYNAVVKEYRDLCRIFTKEQMEQLREIY